VSPFIKSPATGDIDVAEFLSAHPSVAVALEHIRARLRAKAKFEANALLSDLSLILNDWAAERGIDSIAWVSPADTVAIAFPLEMLANRLSERLAEVKFDAFLRDFAASLVDLDRNQQRSG
jgi:hypothetical protein